MLRAVEVMIGFGFVQNVRERIFAIDEISTVSILSWSNSLIFIRNLAWRHRKKTFKFINLYYYLVRRISQVATTVVTRGFNGRCNMTETLR